jgi:alcohol dehydrogenase class IV
MSFQFFAPTRIVFGQGCRSRVAELAAGLGRRALCVSGAHPERHAQLWEELAQSGLECTRFVVSGEPTVEDATAGTALCRAHAAELVIAVGGGSVLDCGKAIAALSTNVGEPLDYLEIIGRGRALAQAGLPCIAVPTTSGTGSEVTKNAVLASLEHGIKVSLRGDQLLPAYAVLDPELTLSVPPATTAATGLDALTQVLEPYVSRQANPLTDALCLEGLRRGARSLRRACEAGHDYAAREDLALTSLFGGLALANAKLGAVHGFAGPIGGQFPAPHGAVCARLLPIVMDVNVRALQARLPHSPILERYEVVARTLTADPGATIAQGVAWLEHTCERLAIPTLSSYGLRPEHHADLIEKARRASSMQGNPLPLETRELQEILERAS